MTRARASMSSSANQKSNSLTIGPVMYLGLSIERSVINAAVLNDGGDFVWQDSHSLDRDKIANLLEICGAIVAKAAKGAACLAIDPVT